MKNKRGFIILLVLSILVVCSLIYSFIRKQSNEFKLNTNVNVTVDLDEPILMDNNITEEDDGTRYARPENVVPITGVDNLTNTNTVQDESNIVNDTEKSNLINIDSTLDLDNFLDNFIKLLETNLSTYTLETLPITSNCYESLDKGVILQDSYNNGFIVLRAGLNTEDNTFMCLIRTVNQRTYLKGTLVDGKIDTITSIVVK